MPHNKNILVKQNTNKSTVGIVSSPYLVKSTSNGGNSLRKESQNPDQKLTRAQKPKPSSKR